MVVVIDNGEMRHSLLWAPWSITIRGPDRPIEVAEPERSFEVPKINLPDSL